ncbi:MAG TPA: biopolymer transporter ExbD [Steroidobacteraceae bacterium]
MCLWVIRQAARKAPPALAGRLEEEWLADMSERRGPIPHLRFALGCLWAVTLISITHAPTAAAAGSSLGRAPLAQAAARTPAPGLYLRKPATTAPSAAMCEINTTPLIDIMLVLLVTLLVSLPMMTHAVKIDLPQGSPATAPPPQVVDLDIDSDGTVAWNGTAVAGFAQLEGYLTTESQKEPQPEIRLRPDRRARYEVVAQVLAAAQRHHMQRIGFVNTGEFQP